MAVNVKMGVDLSGFNSGIRQGQAILKGLNAEMKATEAEFKATGNSEQKLANQTKTLNSQLQVQKGIADQAAAALKKLDAAGVQPTDVAYQKLYATLMNAQAGMNEAQAALNALDGSQQQAASSANALATSVNSIGKKISLDQVISGINSITSGLEHAAQKAVQLGETIWNSIMDSAKWADDTATQAMMFGIDVETYQRMQKLVTNGMDTTVEAMLKSQQKLKKGIGSESKAAIEALQELGVAWDETIGAGKYGDVTQVRDTMEVFWEAGQKILAMKDDPNAQEDMAQALFGRSWRELVPLFDKYKSVEEYNEALENTKINSEEEVNALAELNDKVSELKGNFDTLSREVMAQLAPALTEAAKALNGLLEKVLEYLETPEGKEMLKSLSDSVSSLFEDLGEIDPESVVQSFTTVFNGLIDGLKWIVDNKGTLVSALEVVVAGWAGLKLTGGVLEIVKLVDGISGLTASTAATSGATAGAAWGGAFARAVITAAPWLIGLYTLLNPAGTAGEDIDTTFANGKVTTAGWEFWNNNLDAWNARLTKVGNRYGDLGTLINDEIALNIIGNTTIDDEEVFRQLEEQLSLKPLDIPFEPVVEDNAAENLAEQVGVVEVPAVLVFSGTARGLFTGGAGAGGGKYSYMAAYANGTPYVPQTELALLHKGERVLTASENKSYTYNSNNYFGNVNLNNGQDIEALCDSIDRHNRRRSSGYGS